MEEAGNGDFEKKLFRESEQGGEDIAPRLSNFIIRLMDVSQFLLLDVDRLVGDVDGRKELILSPVKPHYDLSQECVFVSLRLLRVRNEVDLSISFDSSSLALCKFFQLSLDL